METKNMIYIVSEYASQGEIFGKPLSQPANPDVSGHCNSCSSLQII